MVSLLLNVPTVSVLIGANPEFPSNIYLFCVASIFHNSDWASRVDPESVYVEYEIYEIVAGLVVPVENPVKLSIVPLTVIFNPLEPFSSNSRMIPAEQIETGNVIKANDITAAICFVFIV